MSCVHARSLSRWFAAVAIFGLLLAAAGCVYSRLHEFGQELKRWEGRVEVRQGPDTYTLRFANPVLEPGDLRWMGLNPTSEVEEASGRRRWEWVFTCPQAREARGTAVFKNGKLAELGLPAEIASGVFPPPLLRRLGQFLGYSSADAGAPHLATRSDCPAPMPGLRYPEAAAVRAGFGLPEDLAPTLEGGDCVLRYEYMLRTAERDRTFFRWLWRHDPATGEFRSLRLTWSQAVVIIRPSGMEVWLPSALRKKEEREAAERAAANRQTVSEAP